MCLLSLPNLNSILDVIRQLFSQKPLCSLTNVMSYLRKKTSITNHWTQHRRYEEHHGFQQMAITLQRKPLLLITGLNTHVTRTTLYFSK